MLTLLPFKATMLSFQTPTFTLSLAIVHSIVSIVHSYMLHRMCAMCSTNRVTLLDTYQYDDTAHDYFNREPYCAKFGLQNAGMPDILRTLRT